MLRASEARILDVAVAAASKPSNILHVYSARSAEPAPRSIGENGWSRRGMSSKGKRLILLSMLDLHYYQRFVAWLRLGIGED